MKKLLCLLISAVIVMGIFTALPLSSTAATKRVSLKSSSATLKITKKGGKNVFSSTTIKLKKAKGVTVKKVTYKSFAKSVAAVNSKGKITAKKQGSAKISVKVKYKFNKRLYTKTLYYVIKVRDLRSKPSPVSPTQPQTSPTEPTTPEEELNAEYTRLNNVFKPTGTGNMEFSDTNFLKKLSKFSNKLYQMSAEDVTDNYSLSPVSVYMALAMLHSIGDDGVKLDVEELVGMTDGDIAKTGELFKYLTKVYKYNGETVGRLDLTNSIWLDKGLETNPETLKMLADDYYCDALETPFSTNNPAANDAVKKFIKKQTNGLIDRDFEIPADTLFALINTLYFKDVWDVETQELRTEQRDFTTAEGTQKSEFLIGKYLEGQVQETDSSYYFFTKTNAGYKTKFILPKDGYTLKQAMSAENLDKINADMEFNHIDNGTKHYTRCIFPSFKIESSTPLKKILAKNNMLTNAFSYYTSPLVAEGLQVSDIKHNVVIDVSKTGIEGAAVTMVISKAGAAFDETPKKYHDFVLNKNFGFIITDKNDVVLFEGQVTNPKK